VATTFVKHLLPAAIPLAAPPAITYQWKLIKVIKTECGKIEPERFEAKAKYVLWYNGCG